MNVVDAMSMSPNDYIKTIEEKDREIQRLKKIVEEVTENIKVVGRQNTRLKKKCNRYEKQLSSIYLNGDFK